jgi:hypothetical protein
MLVINKNANNTLVMTLTEKSTLSSPYFLFEFKSDITNNRVVFLASDLSNYNDRYNKFLITETSGTVDLTSGTIELNPTGTWTYRVFEQTSSINLNPNLVDNKTPLEIGIVKVKGTETTYITNSDTDNTFIVNE